MVGVGVPHLRSGGYPIQVWMVGGYPIPGGTPSGRVPHLGEGYPILGGTQGTPARSGWWGVPHPRGYLGYPLPGQVWMVDLAEVPP